MDTNSYLLVGLGLLLIFLGSSIMSAVGRVNAKLSAVMTALGLESTAVKNLPEDIRAQTLDLLARGEKIEAIKLVRASTGCGLKEAKDAVEALA